ncbi:hypothetical protein KAW48_06845, partial [candidate division WOR-3 bacterium]|nr:hypothetical protein [candidate division WOR-3 bacterium]
LPLLAMTIGFTNALERRGVGALTNQCVTVAKDGKNTNILTLDYITIFYIIRRNFAFKTQRLRKI